MPGACLVERAEDRTWESARRPLGPALRGLVLGHCGYVERSPGTVCRREVPHGGVVLIISFGDRIRVGPDRAATTASFGSFVAGVHDSVVATEHAGRQHGMQVDLSPLGAYRLLSVPMDQISNRVFDLDALLGRRCDELVDRLATASGWEQRFSLLDERLARWIDDGPRIDRAVEWAYDQLTRSCGAVPIGVLADEIGWSRRHLINRFRRQVGLAPKSYARVLRFKRATDLLRAGHGARIADVAIAAGYADHSHLARDCQALAGATPSELAEPPTDAASIAMAR
ncbi:MAG: helix-turn-helix domain-containing protein [Actinomycetota bacterium]|nr:helix-turn-helix domain-containing protein [Actinomycetota bacterium]